MGELWVYMGGWFPVCGDCAEKEGYLSLVSYALVICSVLSLKLIFTISHTPDTLLDTLTDIYSHTLMDIHSFTYSHGQFLR